jgi:hypothetical protein
MSVSSTHIQEDFFFMSDGGLGQLIWVFEFPYRPTA